MMDWTDRHCRYFHRLMTLHTLLYTEMVVADAILHGDRDKLLGFNSAEHPLALQVGGSDPAKLAEVARISQIHGFDEINLNVGCPSDRVQSGTFGACLMREPKLVGECVRAMKGACEIPVTVKCRIGVDDQEAEVALNDLAFQVWEAGCDRLWVHARKAWLDGLSPKENRDIPPLDYQRVYRLKSQNMNQFIGINGGIETLIQSRNHLSQVDGAMMGRAAYHTPAILRHADRVMFDDLRTPVSYFDVVAGMIEYAERHLSTGGRLNQITRHMVGLFHGKPGARRWRQVLSTESVKHGAGPEVIQQAFSSVQLDQDVQAA